MSRPVSQRARLPLRRRWCHSPSCPRHWQRFRPFLSSLRRQKRQIDCCWRHSWASHRSCTVQALPVSGKSPGRQAPHQDLGQTGMNTNKNNFLFPLSLILILPEQRKGNVEWISIHFSEARGRILIAGMRILPSFFSPKTAPKSKVWRGHLRQGSQDFIDCINGLGNFRGISGLIHPDHAVFH